MGVFILRIAIIGNKGNMGRRYESILNSLQIDHFGVDLLSSAHIKNDLEKESFSHAIIASPTITHASWMQWLYDHDKTCRILCEKPITKDLNELVRILSLPEIDLTMVYNYEYVEYKDLFMGDCTTYNFYNSGGDGLYWDCIQIIGLAKGELVLSNESPIWRCVINGRKVKKESIDNSYMEFLKAWINYDFKQNHKTLIDIHVKTAMLNHGKDSNLHTSKNE